MPPRTRRAASRSEAGTTAPRPRRTVLVTLLAALALGLLTLLSPVANAVPTGAATQTESDADARRAAAEASAAARRAGTTTTPRPTTTTPRPATTTPRPTTTTPQPTTTTPRPTTTAPATTAPAGDALARVLAITNSERAKVGCTALVRNAALDRAAQLHSQYQAETRTMSHTGRGGSNGGQRITAEGYRWTRWGENVAYGYTTPEAVMSAWMNSPGHRANILDCRFKEIGLGLGQPGYYWTQKFATR